MHCDDDQLILKIQLQDEATPLKTDPDDTDNPSMSRAPIILITIRSSEIENNKCVAIPREKKRARAK